MPRAKTATSLREWYVISLRPQEGLASLRRAARKHGATVFALPTLRLSPLDAHAQLSAALRADVVIVTSPAAARHAHSQRELRQKRRQTWFAVGAGTAAVLRRIGLHDVHTPAQGNDSAALLRHPLLADLRGKSIGVLTAPGGRDLIAAAVRARGGTLLRADVYRREPARVAAHRWQRLQALPATSVVFMSSAEALDNLWRAAATPERARLLHMACITSSPRLSARAAALGWPAPVLAASALPADMLAALAAHVALGRFR